MLASTRTSARPLHPSHNAFQCSVIKQQAVAGVEHRHDPVIEKTVPGIDLQQGFEDMPCPLSPLQEHWTMSCSKALRDNLAPCHLRRALGHAGEAFRLEVVLPGAVQVRQQALWHWLRRSDSARAFFAGHAPAAGM